MNSTSHVNDVPTLTLEDPISMVASGGSYSIAVEPAPKHHEHGVSIAQEYVGFVRAGNKSFH